MSVRPVREEDVHPLAAALARAFHDDPVTSWVYAGERRRPTLVVALLRLAAATPAAPGRRLDDRPSRRRRALGAARAAGARTARETLSAPAPHAARRAAAPAAARARPGPGRGAPSGTSATCTSPSSASTPPARARASARA